MTTLYNSSNQPPTLDQLKLYALSSNAEVVLVGEAPGRNELHEGVPFVGQSGQLLRRALMETGIFNYSATNVFHIWPPYGKVENLFSTSKDLPSATWPFRNRYFKRSTEIEGKAAPERLEWELDLMKPKLIIALGGTAVWALLGRDSISDTRGFLEDTKWGPLIATYHPAAVMRNKTLYPTMMLDLKKAKKLLAGDRPIERTYYTDPTEAELEEFKSGVKDLLAVDIETTRQGGLLCVGFASSPTVGLCVPLDEGPLFKRYVRFIRDMLLHPAEKLFHNGLFDLYYLYEHGFRVHNAKHDTFLLHYAMYAELPKSLRYMVSIYCNAHNWKNEFNSAKIEE